MCIRDRLHVAYLGGVLLQTVHDKLDVGAVQFQKAGTHDLVREVCPRDPGGLSFGTDRFYQQLYDLIQVIQIKRITLLQTVILDILQNQDVYKRQFLFTPSPCWAR